MYFTSYHGLSNGGERVAPYPIDANL